jgi:hypothetical protein
MLGKHMMPDGEMMEDSQMLGAAGQAEALAADASIQEFHKKLAASGAAAAQPKSGMTGMGELASEGREAAPMGYSEVEPDDAEDF